MKSTYNTYLFLLISIITCFCSSCTKIDTDKVNHSFQAAIDVNHSINEFEEVKFESFDDLNLGFFRGNLWIKLEIKNDANLSKSYMFVSNDRLNRNYVFYKLDTLDHAFKLVNHIKDVSKKDYRTFNNPNPNLKIDLAKNEQATYLITSTGDGRIKDATPKIISLDSYFSFINMATLWNIVFYGIIVGLLLINIYQWNIYKRKIYVYYIFYITFTLLVYLGIEGYLTNLRVKQITIDHFVFVSVKLWALSLILYTAKFLEIQIVAPRYYRFIKMVLLVVLGGTLLYQFTFYTSSIQYLHFFENVLSSLWLLLIIGMILFSLKTRSLELKYYLIPLAGFILLTICGLINAHFQILSANSFTFVKIGAIVELIGFTYFMTVLIKKKIRNTEQLENEVLENRKQLQTATIEIEEKVRMLAAQTKLEKTDLIGIFNLLENSLVTENKWEDFKLRFEKLNPNFYHALISIHPNLTKSEIRLLILFNIGYSQKEVAEMLHIAPDSVKKARSRVRKKLSIDEKQNLNVYLKAL